MKFVKLGDSIWFIKDANLTLSASSHEKNVTNYYSL